MELLGSIDFQILPWEDNGFGSNLDLTLYLLSLKGIVNVGKQSKQE